MVTRRERVSRDLRRLGRTGHHWARRGTATGRPVRGAKNPQLLGILIRFAGPRPFTQANLVCNTEATLSLGENRGVPIDSPPAIESKPIDWQLIAAVLATGS